MQVQPVMLAGELAFSDVARRRTESEFVIYAFLFLFYLFRDIWDCFRCWAPYVAGLGYEVNCSRAAPVSRFLVSCFFPIFLFSPLFLLIFSCIFLHLLASLLHCPNRGNGRPAELRVHAQIQPRTQGSGWYLYL